MQGFIGPTKSKPDAKVLLFPELRKKKRNFLGKRGCFYEFWGRIVQFEGIQSVRWQEGEGGEGRVKG
jgi:hypothetical protein